jgi:uncharacterized protein (TIGR03067 family)
MDKELDKFQGRWELILLKRDGMAASPSEILGASIIFKKDCFIESTQDYEFSGRISFRSGASHNGLDMSISVNCACEKRLKGIYAWDGDLLKICFSENEDTPDVLDAQAGTGRTLKVFKKAT